MRLLPLRQHPIHISRYVEMSQEFHREQDKKYTQNESITATEKALMEKLCDSSRELFVFEFDDQIIGFAEVVLEEKCFPDEDLPELALRILLFYIRPESRRQALGSHAFKLLRQWGHDKEVALIEVEVNKESSGNQFLKKQGLDLVGEGVSNIYRAFV